MPEPVRDPSHQPSSEPPDGPAYRIETARLVLRCYQPTDAPLVKSAVDASLAELRPWMPWAGQKPATLEEEARFLRQLRGNFDLGQSFAYGAFSPDERELYGSAGLDAHAGAHAFEIGYWIATAHAGKGLATELTGAIVRVGFEVAKVNHLEIHCDPDNPRSAAVARKLGFTHEATIRQRSPRPDGSKHYLMIWTMFADDYPGSAAAQLPLRAFDVLGKPLLC